MGGILIPPTDLSMRSLTALGRNALAPSQSLFPQAWNSARAAPSGSAFSYFLLPGSRCGGCGSKMVLNRASSSLGVLYSPGLIHPREEAIFLAFS